MNLYKNVLIICLFLSCSITMASGSQQYSNGTIIGDNNQQTTFNDYDYYDTSSEQVLGIGLTDSDGNTIIAFNDNSDGKTEIDTQYADSSTTINYNFLPDPKALHYTLDTGFIASEVTSIYLGEVLVITNNRNDSIIQMEGEKYKYTIKSSIPVLAYIIKSSDGNKVRSDDGAPVYQWVEQKYTHGNVQVVHDREHMSTFQQFIYDIKDTGKYALVIDTRVSQHRNGLLSKITDDTVDIYYSIDRLIMNQTSVAAVTYDTVRNVSTFPVDDYGRAITS